MDSMENIKGFNGNESLTSILKNELENKTHSSENSSKDLRRSREVEIKEDEDEMTKLRKSLPIYPYRNDILNALKENQILIVVGETGSGKSTQISQYLLEEGFADNGKVIAVTQPRRVGN